jgi:hypothetical protein
MMTTVCLLTIIVLGSRSKFVIFMNASYTLPYVVVDIRLHGQAAMNRQPSVLPVL